MDDYKQYYLNHNTQYMPVSVVLLFTQKYVKKSYLFYFSFWVFFHVAFFPYFCTKIRVSCY